ncbi:hypothetical protein AS579_17445 [Acinetobacter baumannii]|jgi:hypothetical protein|uniref:Uncharacterized protein n=2 Tax=Acinetobacter calcoaceticus/baumannii complex TaxID=909768 RepID=A0A2H4ZHV7_ACIPI|nr:hypothetical protein [Acinetobacter schindleri]AUF80811.1 hypothetical protein [Acinetobacter pittii]KZA07096.1 hypothetical protein LV36_03787 [Acinetobacter baumannii]PZM05930.1 hypothetical protein DOL92_02625 [Acinetobacter nosocomialis]MDP1445958.1 hypothetical protein [Acinetobacter schindleri]OCY82055.1 hypothetical protein BFR89_09920 [Acinetobacter pittii]
MPLLTDTTISESMLVESLENDAITHIRIIPIEGKFSVYISLNWKDGESLLVTSKKQPRFWSSLDRLFRFITDKSTNSHKLQISITAKG